MSVEQPTSLKNQKIAYQSLYKEVGQHWIFFNQLKLEGHGWWSCHDDTCALVTILNGWQFNISCPCQYFSLESSKSNNQNYNTIASQNILIKKSKNHKNCSKFSGYLFKAPWHTIKKVQDQNERKIKSLDWLKKSFQPIILYSKRV